MKSVLTLITVVFLHALCSGQWQEFSFHAFGKDLGLTVHDIVQDNQGYIYAASNKGLVRFDGNTLHHFIHDATDPNSIAPGSLNKLIKSTDEFIWMTTRRGHLCRFDPKQETFSTFTPPNLGNGFFRILEGLLEDKEGNIWVGGYHFRLFRFDPKKKQFDLFIPDWINPYTHPGRLSIFNMVLDKNDPNTIWLSVQDMNYGKAMQFGQDLIKFNSLRGEFEHKIIFPGVRFIDEDNRLWGKGYANYLAWTQLPLADKIFIDTILPYYSDSIVNHILTDLVPYQEGFLLSSEHGVYTIINESVSFVKGSEELGYIRCLYLDNQNRIWAGGTNGLFMLQPSKIRKYSYSNLGHKELVMHTSTMLKDSIIYLITQTRSPSFSQKLHAIPIADSDNLKQYTFSHQIDKMTSLNDDNLLILSRDNKMYTFNISTEKWSNSTFNNHHPLSGYRYDLSVHSDSLMLLTVSHQLAIGNLNSGKILHIWRDSLTSTEGQGFTNNSLRGHTPLDDSRILVFNRDLAVYNLDDRSIRRIRIPKNINNGVMSFRAVILSSNKELWMSNTQQLFRAKIESDSLTVIQKFDIAQGFSSTQIFNIVEDKNQRIWTFSLSGINTVDPATNEVRFFGIESGLSHLSTSAAQLLEDGRILYTDWYSMNVFHPDSLWKTKDPILTRPIVQEMRLDGQPLSRSMWHDNILKLDHVNQIIDVTFQAINFPSSAEIQYYYRLKNLNNNWNSIGTNNFLTLSTLPPGDFILQISTDPEASDQYIQSIQINVPTPFFKSYFFYGLLFGVIGFLSYLFTQRRIKLSEKKSREALLRQQEVLRLELKALRSQMNPHFMFNSLNSVKNYILLNDSKLAAKYLSNFSHLIRMILQQSREKYISLQEELDMLQLYLRLEQLRFSDSFNHSISLGKGIESNRIYLPPMLLQPFIENAIWHGLSTKDGDRHLHIRFERSQNHLHCSIDDNGIGRQKAKTLSGGKSTKHKSMGMGITSNRINLLNELERTEIHLDILDKKDEQGNPTGTRVDLFIPQDIYQD